MKKIFVVMSVLIAAQAIAKESGRHEPAACIDGQIQVLVLGTFHMSNPGLDGFKFEADDVLSNLRQKEIKILVGNLAKFAPDKVMVEAAYGNGLIQERYDAFRAGEIELGRNETYQVAFRLAAQLDHDGVYPIDYPMFQDSTAYEFYMARNPAVKMKEGTWYDGIAELSAKDQVRLRESTISEYLASINSADSWAFGLDSRLVLQNTIMYAEYDQFAGADILTSWYKRNIRMLANFHRSLDEDDTKAMMLVGSGHNKILWELIETSPVLCRIDARDYL
jgi:hypothetical protein